MRRFSVLVIGIVCMPSLAAAVLSVHPRNPRYFADGSGGAIYLGGHQIFVDLQDNSFNKEFTRGYHFTLYDKPFEDPDAEGPEWWRVRSNVGQAVEYSNRLDLANVSPRGDLASTGFCLAKPDYQYVAYQPGDGPITISGLRAETSYYYELYDTGQARVVGEGRIRASGSDESFESAGKGTVLYISSSIIGE